MWNFIYLKKNQEDSIRNDYSDIVGFDIVKIKVVPSPIKLVKSIVPPCNSTSFSVIGKPRPVPSVSLINDDSTLLNSLKIKSLSFSWKAKDLSHFT